MPDSTKEPTRRMKLPSTIKGNRGRARNEPIEPKSAEVSEGEMDCSILDSHDEELDNYELKSETESKPKNYNPYYFLQSNFF